MSVHSIRAGMLLQRNRLLNLGGTLLLCLKSPTKTGTGVALKRLTDYLLVRSNLE